MHALYVGLICCHGKSEGPCQLHTWGTAPPNAQVRRDDFPGSRVRKCIHIIHRISISSWHHDEHIVPAFVRYHIPVSHFAWEGIEKKKKVKSEILKFLNLGPSRMFSKQSCFRTARLGKLGGNLLTVFPINRQKGVVPNIPHPPGYEFQLFWVKKIVSVKKIEAEVLPYRFRDVSVSKSVKVFCRSSPFFIRSSFFNG